MTTLPHGARPRAAKSLVLAALLAGCADSITKPADSTNVVDHAVASVEISPAGPTVVVGKTTTLSAQAKNAAGTVISGVTFSWSSDKPAIARVDAVSGVVTGVAEGSASISVAGGGKSASTTVAVTAPPLTSTGTIAYARANELRLVEPDGSGDHLVWAAPPVPGQPSLSRTVTGTAWRPDGGEIAFSSDHEEAVSVYRTDIYAVRPDGLGLRRITNAPALAGMASYAKGVVKVTVVNMTSTPGPYFIYVQGAPEPQSASLGAGASRVFTFTDVADLGSATQSAVAINGLVRFSSDAAVDVRAGQVVDAGTITITQYGGVEDYGASDPFWRADASKIGYLGPLCIAGQAPSTGIVGYSWNPLFDPGTFKNLCLAEWGPTAATANQLLLVSAIPDDAGEMHVYRVTEGSAALGQPILSFGGYVHVTDIHWLADGSGLVVAKEDDLLDRDVNLWEYKFGASAATRLTDFHFGGNEFGADSVMRRFATSPDGSRVVFEKTDDLLFGKSDLWIADRNGANAHLLKAGAGHPAWNSNRP